MAQLSTFATTASNVSTNAQTREVVISNEVVEIDGALDPPTGFDDWGGWTITCQSSGGFRSVAGASGTLGGGVQSLKIVEAANAHRFGGDNFESNGNGTTARFSGDNTNVMKYHNVVWIVLPGARSDFDIARGSHSSGSAGPIVELSGVRLIQLTTSDQTAHFNHYSGRAKIVSHPHLGFGLSIRNETNGPSIEFSTNPYNLTDVEGLVIDSLTATNNNTGARCAVRLDPLPEHGSINLTGLDTPSIAAVNGSSTKLLLLLDPVGRPTRTDWGSEYHGNFQIARTVPFEFTGATVPAAGATLRGDAQTSGGIDASSLVRGRSGGLYVETDWSADGASGGAWTKRNTYKFYMAHPDLRKWSLTTTQTISNTPAVITAAIVEDELPDGSSISSITVPTTCADLSDVIRLVKSWEVSDPTLAPSTPLAYIDGTSVKFDTGFSVVLSSTATSAITVTTDTVTIKCGATLGVSNGLTTIDASGSSKTISIVGTVAVDSGVFLKDSSGQKSNVTITNSLGGSALFSVVSTTDGSTIGSATIAAASTGTIEISTKGLGSAHVVVAKRAGFRHWSTAVDLTGGGTRTLTAPAQDRILQPDGSASYLSTLSVTGVTVVDSSSGSTPGLRIGIGNETLTARQIFKAQEDFLVGSGGAKFLGLGGSQPTYIRDTIKGDQYYLGAHSKVRRNASTDINAKVRASLFSNDDAPVDGVNGDIQTVEGLNIPALATRLLIEQDFDPVEAGTQSVWGRLSSIDTAVSSLTAPPSASAVATAVWGSTSRTLTSTGAPTASEIAGAVWDEIVDSSIRGPIEMELASLNGIAMVPTAAGVARLSEITTGDPLVFTARSTFTYPNLETTYHARVESGAILFYLSRDDALGGVDPQAFEGEGTESAVRFRLTESGRIGTGEYILRGLRSSLADVPSSVWSHQIQDIDADDFLVNIDAATSQASYISLQTERIRSKLDGLVDDFWNELIDPTHFDDLTITPESESGTGFRIPQSDFDLVSTGDSVTFTALGGYEGIRTGTTYHLFKGGQRTIYFYSTRDAALAGGGDYIQPTGAGTVAQVRMVVPSRHPAGYASYVLRQIQTVVTSDVHGNPNLKALIDGIPDSVWGADLDPGLAGTQDIRAALRNINVLSGSNFVESGLSMQGALRLALAVLAGRMDRSGDTVHFHRRDAAETRILSMDVTATGRSESD